MKKGFLLLFLFVGCGPVPIEPELQEEPQMDVPLLTLPEDFQNIPLTTVRSATLKNTIFEKYYAPPQAAQYFEYQNQYITGYLLKYGDALEARVQHRDAMAHFNSDTVRRKSSDNTISFREGRRFHMFFYIDNCAVYFTLDAQQEGYAYDIADHDLILLMEAKSEVFNRQIRTVNQSTNRIPFYVELSFDWQNIQPPFQTQLKAGEKIPFVTTINYTLAEPEQGEIVIEIRQHDPEVITTTTIPITKGTGSIAYSDTLRPSANIPEGGTTLSIKATLLPAYTGYESPSIIRDITLLERLPDGQTRTTAGTGIDYTVQ
jgi:hypothetical protein